MKLLFCSLLLLLSPPAHASFSAYVRSYQAPQLFETNSLAFDARLKLLDAAPAGAHARIASFEFVNGQVTRLLARHVCLAATRGVRVELLVDSKSGDRPGLPDAFDTTEDKRLVEELYQYMANCGASVLVFNHFEGYVTVLGQHVPNLFGDPSLDGQSVNPIRAVARLDELLDRVEEISREELGADVKPIISALRDAALEVLHFSSVLQDPAHSGYDSSVARLQELYAELLNADAWDSVSPARLRAALPRILSRMRSDPTLAPALRAIRRYNRIQHRKLFVVESGPDGCAFIGSRNLGDAYLTDANATFLDGDVLLCRHHGAEASQAVSQAGDSFEELKNDRSDPALHLANDLSVRLVPRNPAYPYAELIFPASLAPRGLRRAETQGALPAAARTLRSERVWRDEAPVLGDASLERGTRWRLLRSGWNPAEDQVRAELLRMIGNESQEIYLETAYAELGPALRAAIEAALARGVHVRLVSNSFFVTDGASKAIRPLMAPWLERTRSRYGALFQPLLTTVQAGRMIHFKGAAFSCQRVEAGFAHSYLIGSHNFDQRAGRSDKENSLAWDEPIASCNARDSAGQRRGAFYQSLSDRLHAQVLEPYRDFHAEIESSAPADDLTSRAMRLIFFLEGERGYKVKNEARVKQVLKVSEQGGLTDLLGLLL